MIDAASMLAHPVGLPPDGASYQAIAPRPSVDGIPDPDPYNVMPSGNGYWDGQSAAQLPHTYNHVEPPSAVLQPSQPTYHPSATGLEGFDPAQTPTGPPAMFTPVSASGAPLRTPSAPTDEPPTASHRPSMTWPFSPAASMSHATQPPITPAQDSFSPLDLLGRTMSLPQSEPELELQQGSELDFDQVFPQTNQVQGSSDRSRHILEQATQEFYKTRAPPPAPSFALLTPATSHEHDPESGPFDVDSEDELLGTRADISHTNVGVMIARNAQQMQGNIRSMTSYINEPNVLSTYNPEYATSPLSDPTTARVFCHFITATGPTLHVAERHPSNPAVIFSGRPVPKSRQALWSYTLPMLSLRHQGLLHSMLALSSLHIAKLQNSSPTSSLKHYHFALRRIAKAIGNNKKRRDPATLAATLLLGYYEVTTAEHNKWNSHLSGARELILDIPYRRLSARVDAYRHNLAAQGLSYPAQQSQTDDSLQGARRGQDVPTFSDGQLDLDLLSTILGWDIRTTLRRDSVDTQRDYSGSNSNPSSKDVDEYETQLDLFWWFAKQDTYQSILSRNRLLLSYDRWALCPPRAAIGRVDAVYGTMDHLLLLMARLTDYAAKDLPRKKRAALEQDKLSKAARGSPPSNGRPSPGHPPPMYGMIPDPGPIRVPNGFSQERQDGTYSATPPSEYQMSDAAKQDSLNEWTAIAHAFDVFHAALGPAYQPLSEDHMPPLSTPFGPAIYYRSYGIACVLHLYHCGRIILARTHPNMPPAAMVSALVAKKQTQQDANAIGRICAGIHPVSNTAPLNPHHGAALMDCCMGLFHAAIQFTDPGQRGWTIIKLRDVARLTGWQTSSLIAAGCERSWIHFAELGHGPPYERTMNKVAKDDRVAGRSRDPEHLRQEPRDNNDRRFVTVNPGTRVYWAMGILSVEEDMRDLNLGE